MKDNLATVTAINHDADVNTRHQALADAESVEYLYFLSDAMGPRLGRAFLAAYDKGELGKAAALIKASEVSTGAAKKYFHYPRPYQVPGNTIHLTPDDVVVKRWSSLYRRWRCFPQRTHEYRLYGCAVDGGNDPGTL
ncbi:phosphatase [Salmonella enterica subsp. enterica]|uniref:Phosphatase n=1 Tax=Salmonella enterica I TaxID=59201 RepID=A0A447TT31_SALET|nr:phosphatase [Salmonella enterica subsp. enterica]